MAHDASSQGRIYASFVSRLLASHPIAAKAASERATTTTMFVATTILLEASYRRGMCVLLMPAAGLGAQRIANGEPEV
jgi:hypothetical protein